MPDPTNLADHPDYSLTLHRAEKEGSNKLLVTFGNIASDKALSGFGTEFALKNNWDTVYVAQRKNTQYQGLSLDQFFDSIYNIALGRDLICYGSSLGGYAALYYGGVLDARIIAASPLNSAMPEFLVKRFSELKFAHAPLQETPVSMNAPVIFYDSTSDRDSRVVTEKVLPAYPDARLVRMPHAGHGVLETMLHAKVLKKVITGLVENDNLVDFHIPTETSEIWHANVGTALIGSDPTKAIQHFERSLEIRPNQQAYNRIVRLLIDTGRRDEAQRIIESPPRRGARKLALSPGNRAFVERKGFSSI